MRLATAVAGALALAAAVMVVLAFVTGGDGDEPEAAPPVTTAQVNRGLAVWQAQGCGSCHTLAAANAHGKIGPDLAASLKGKPASYIRESIVDPGAYAADGSSAGIMPDDFATRISAADLGALVRFLQASATH